MPVKRTKAKKERAGFSGTLPVFQKSLAEFAAAAANKVFIMFAFTILTLNLLAILVGENARSVSSIFSLGSAGISVGTTLQFLLSSAILTGLRFLFFSDSLRFQASLWPRSLCMLGSAFVVLVGLILAFEWFPVKKIKDWALFLFCFPVPEVFW